MTESFEDQVRKVLDKNGAVSNEPNIREIATAHRLDTARAVREAQIALVKYFDQIPANELMDWKGLFADTLKTLGDKTEATS